MGGISPLGPTGTSQWTYEDVVFNDSNGISYKVLRSYTVLDWWLADVATKVQIIRLFDPIITPSNIVSSCGGEDLSVDNVIITTNDQSINLDFSNCDMSNGLLEYINCVAVKNNIADGSSFQIEFSKTGDDLNGVSTLDIVFVQRHILGLANLNSVCSLLSADVNSDGQITGIDLVETRKLILGISSSYPNSPNWKFFNRKILDNQLPGVNEDSDLNFSKDEFPLTELEIVGIKIGDVNDTSFKNQLFSFSIIHFFSVNTSSLFTFLRSLDLASLS